MAALVIFSDLIIKIYQSQDDKVDSEVIAGLNEPVFCDDNDNQVGRNSAILSSGLRQIWRLFTKLYSAV